MSIVTMEFAGWKRQGQLFNRSVGRSTIKIKPLVCVRVAESQVASLISGMHIPPHVAFH